MVDRHDPYEDPSAGELVERHKSIHSCSTNTPPTSRRPPLTVTIKLISFEKK